nr:hypothetical protein [Sphingopyxis bauzanensis]
MLRTGAAAPLAAIALPGVAQMLAHGVRREFEMASDPPNRIALGGPDETLPLPVRQARTNMHAVGIGDAVCRFEGGAADHAGKLQRIRFGSTPRPPCKGNRAMGITRNMRRHR